MDERFFEEMELRIPKGRVRTRFAPSPTGYMHVGNLRTAIYAYLIAKKAGGQFILRIEDTDRGRLVEGATGLIFRTLRDTGLFYDEGPDVGGPCGPYIQSERMEIYQKYADRLVALGGAYYCFCEKQEDVGDAVFGKKEDPCLKLSAEEALRRVRLGEPHVVRQKMPAEGKTVFCDAIYGEIGVDNAGLEDQILLKSDKMPTYNMANVIDDHLMGITHVVRGSEYLSSAPKYNLLYSAFGWEVPEYVHCPPVMKNASEKLSKRKGDPSYEDLLDMGFLKEAVINYVTLLGWSPGGERELFSLPELVTAFDIKGISKSPAIFDMEKLTWFNGEYIRALSEEEFFEAALPYLKAAVTRPDIDLKTAASLLKARTERLTDIPETVDFIDALPQYEISLYEHRKMKTTPEGALFALKEAFGVVSGLADFSRDAVHDALTGKVSELGIKTGQLLWPIRVALSGKPSTPGGGIELLILLGRAESLKRIQKGIELLETQNNPASGT